MPCSPRRWPLYDEPEPKTALRRCTGRRQACADDLRPTRARTRSCCWQPYCACTACWRAACRCCSSGAALALRSGARALSGRPFRSPAARQQHLLPSSRGTSIDAVSLAQHAGAIAARRARVGRARGDARRVVRQHAVFHSAPFRARFRHAARSTRAAQARASATAAACVHACCSPEPAAPSRCRRRPPRRARAAVWAAKTSALPLQRRAPSPSPRRVWYVLRARLLARAPYPRRPAGRAALLHALAGRRPRAMAGRARPRERARDRLPPRRRPLSRSPRDPFRPVPTQLAASLRTAARALPGAGGTPARWVSAARVGRRRPPRRAALAAVAAARCERLSARAATILFFFPPLRRRTQPFGALKDLSWASASMCECPARARELLV